LGRLAYEPVVSQDAKGVYRPGDVLELLLAHVLERLIHR
jgi:hypothetical protein